MYQEEISSDSSDTTIVSSSNRTSRDFAPGFYDLSSLGEESLESSDPIVERFSPVDSSRALQQILNKYLGSDSSSCSLSCGKSSENNSSIATSSRNSTHTTTKCLKIPEVDAQTQMEKVKSNREENLPENCEENLLVSKKNDHVDLKDLSNKYLISGSSYESCGSTRKQPSSSTFSSCSQNWNNPNSFDNIEKYFDSLKTLKDNIQEDVEGPDIAVKKRKVITNNNSPEERNKKKQMLEQDKLARKLERERKKEEKRKEKELKKLRDRVQKGAKREECLKNITVKLEESVCSENYGDAIKIILNENQVAYETVHHKLKSLIYWTRKIQTIEGMNFKETYCDEKHYLIILPSREFILLSQQNQLTDYIASILSQLKFKHITIIVYGIQKPTEEQELSILRVEMLYKCYWQFEKKSDGLAKTLMAITKAVAQIPYKEEKKQKYKLQSELFSESNKDTVSIDKKGNGMRRLWHQMLTMFPLARLETAEAITAAYPTPSSLFKAYEEQEGNKDELLQNLPIRRAHGPLTAIRRIGPELSKKCSSFFNFIEDDYL